MNKAHDISGFPIFSDGELGFAHQMAHRFKDLGRFEEGYAFLSGWLEGRTGSGSQWVHVQWHLMVFELATGRWDAAHARFVEQVFEACGSGVAPVDAPSALWRLQLAAPGATLPWQPVRACAAAALTGATDRYEILHHLLALAGAGDVQTLDRWLSNRTGADVLTHLGRALRAFAAEDYALAMTYFELGLPELRTLGGSRAQNGLFHDLYATAFDRLGHLPGATETIEALAA